MLSFFRRLINSKVGVIVTFIVLGIIALAFAAGDVTGLRQGGGSVLGSNVGTVGKVAIGDAEVKQRATSEMESYRQQQPTLDMAQYVAGGGVDATVERIMAGLALQQFGASQGIVVSKRLVDGQLASIPGLQGIDGKFDQKIYERLLSERRLTDAGIRADIANTTMANFLIAPTSGASQVPQSLALPYASLLLEKREGQIGFIPTKAMTAGAVPTDAEMQAWYKGHLALYTTPERRIIRYAVVTPEQVKASSTPSAAEIAAAYNADKAKYAATEKRAVTQVTVLDQNAANQLAAKVKAGTALTDAAKAAGLEARTVTLDRAAYAQQASADLTNAVFSAARGALVGPVKGSIGFVVARVDSIEQVPGKSLAEATPEITRALAAQKTVAALGKIHDALDDSIADNSNFGELVNDQKLSAQATPPLTAAGVNPEDAASKPDPKIAPVVQAAFQAEEGDQPQLVQLGQDGSFAVVALDRIVRAAPRPLAQVRDAVARDFTIDRARKAARQVAVDVLAKVNKGAALAEALSSTKPGLPAPQPLASSRAQLAANPQGAPPPLALLFSMANGTAKMLEAPQQGGWFVIKLDKIVPGDATKQPGVVAATRTDLGRVIGREYVEQFTNAVKRAVGVKKNAAEIAKVKADLSGQSGSAQP
jgi:peptidyl-prolyl cis-trans isomerase D